MVTTEVRPPAHGQRARYSLESFICGPESLRPYRVAQAVASAPGTAFNPLYIQAPPGLGKTHLLRGIAQRLEERPDLPGVLCVAAETFSHELAASIRLRTADAFHARYQAAGALLIDDVADLAGRAAVLDDLVRTIDALREARRQVVLSGEGDPATIKGLPDRLRSRLAGGAVVRIGRPSLRTRKALARAFAASTQARFTGQALEELAYRAVGGVHELEAGVRQCAHRAGPDGLVDADLAREVLVALRRDAQTVPVRADAETTLWAVCATFGVGMDVLLSPRRDAPIVQARQVAMYLLREDACLPVAQIGRELGRDHSTVLHGCGRIEAAVAAQDGPILEALAGVRETLRSVPSSTG